MSAETTAEKYTNEARVREAEKSIGAVALHDNIDDFLILETDVMAFESKREETKAKVVGHDAAIDAIYDQLGLFETRPTEDTSPAASLVFEGPRGVGKRKVAQVLAESIGDGSGDNIVGIDCFDYLNPEKMQSLIANIANFVIVNSEQQHRGLPSSVLLFENIEDSSADLQYLLLQILDGMTIDYTTYDDEGNECDTSVDWSTTMVVLICDTKEHSLGFQSPRNENGGVIRRVWEEDGTPDLFKNIAPAMANRLDKEIGFRTPSHDEYGEILDIQLEERNEDYIARYGVRVTISEDVREYILVRASKAKQNKGAYSLMDVFADKIQRRLSAGILNDRIEPGTEVHVFIQNGELVFGTRPDDELRALMDEYEDADEDGFPFNVHPGEE